MTIRQIEVPIKDVFKKAKLGASARMFIMITMKAVMTIFS